MEMIDLRQVERQTRNVEINEEKSVRQGLRGNASRMAFLLFFLFLILLLPEPGRAQGGLTLRHGDWEATIFAGGSFLGSNVYSTPVQGSGSRAVGLSFATGSQLGLRIIDNQWRNWGAGLEYSFSNQPINFTNLSDSTPSLGLGQAIHRFAYDVFYYPYDRYHRLRPYAFAGPGVSLFYIKGSSKDAAAAQGIQLNDPWKFTMSWGGGVKYLVKNQIAASFQFSDSISGVPGYGLPKTGSVVSGTYVPGFRPDGLMNNWLISAGFVYQGDDR